MPCECPPHLGLFQAGLDEHFGPDNPYMVPAEKWILVEWRASPPFWMPLYHFTLSSFPQTLLLGGPLLSLLPTSGA